ncbi:hypothetical protein HPB49_020655 [Dermacentor silvarum]|uniref:Uncharacterized protein n=1 Tax=Dermacentor silvarum TaxID=543639 RepID=A0ACB8C5D4_DERSI|nr:hypothetical protein HPB49_020655 [Dermacentor silvarum]
MAATQVEGETLLAEDFTEDLGWRTVSSRKSRATTKPGLGDGGARSEMPERRGAGEWRKGLVIKNRIVKASRMPPMPEEHIKIVIRPRDGLNLEKVSPPTERARAELATAAAKASQLASAPQGSPRRRSRSRSLSRSKQRPSSGTPVTGSRSVSREARVRFPAAGGGGGTAGGQTTWADKGKGGISTGERVSRLRSMCVVIGIRIGLRNWRENRSLKAAVDGLVKEIAELRRGLPSGNSGSLGQASKHDDRVEVPTSVEAAEGKMDDEETPAPKKRALSSMVQPQGKVRSELKEMMATL